MRSAPCPRGQWAWAPTPSCAELSGCLLPVCYFFSRICPLAHVFGVPAGIWLSLLRPLAVQRANAVLCPGEGITGRTQAPAGLPHVPTSLSSLRVLCPESPALAETVLSGSHGQAGAQDTGVRASPTPSCTLRSNPHLHPLLARTRLWPACPLCPCRAQLHQDSLGLCGHSGGTDVHSIVPLRAAPEKGPRFLRHHGWLGFLEFRCLQRKL